LITVGVCSLREEHDTDIDTGKYGLIFRADDNQTVTPFRLAAPVLWCCFLALP